MNKKGNLTLYIVFMISAIVLVLISAFLSPMGVLFNTKMYAAGEDIYLRANESIADINNATVRNTIYGIVSGGLSAVESNIEVNNALFQYGWILLVSITALVIFVYARRQVEVGGGGLV